MCMHQLENIKECLIAQVQGQMGNLSQVDTEELGEAIDMIKDVAEAIYYCTVTEAMEKSTEEKESTAYYRDVDRGSGRMYYTDSGNMGSHSGGTRNFSSGSSQGRGSSSSYSSPSYYEERDMREGRSPMSRKSYMESKQMNHDKATQVKELEKYISELTADITEMIEGASQDEKQLLQRKISTLATKIV